MHSLISYVQVAEKRLSEGGQGNRNRDEAGWFMKISWNLALQCGENYREMGDLFIACYKVSCLLLVVSVIPSPSPPPPSPSPSQLSHHLVTDQAVLVRRKTCQLMSAAARLHQARDTSTLTEKVRTEMALEDWIFQIRREIIIPGFHSGAGAGACVRVSFHLPADWNPDQ